MGIVKADFSTSWIDASFSQGTLAIGWANGQTQFSNTGLFIWTRSGVCRGTTGIRTWATTAAFSWSSHAAVWRIWYTVPRNAAESRWTCTDRIGVAWFTYGVGTAGIGYGTRIVSGVWTSTLSCWNQNNRGKRCYWSYINVIEIIKIRTGCTLPELGWELK